MQVVGVSVDSKFTHLAFANTPRNKGGLGGCKYPLLSDITKTISKAYNVLIEEGDDAGVSLRGLFIISPTGILRQITVNDLPVGRSVDETLRLVKAFQFTDTHGEVCPAGWVPGAKTMKDNPKDSQVGGMTAVRLSHKHLRALCNLFNSHSFYPLSLLVQEYFSQIK